MGSVPSKGDIIKQLNALDEREKELNRKMHEIQGKLNHLLPKSEEVFLKENLDDPDLESESGRILPIEIRRNMIVANNLSNDSSDDDRNLDSDAKDSNDSKENGQKLDDSNDKEEEINESEDKEEEEYGLSDGTFGRGHLDSESDYNEKEEEEQDENNDNSDESSFNPNKKARKGDKNAKGTKKKKKEEEFQLILNRD